MKYITTALAALAALSSFAAAQDDSNFALDDRLHQSLWGMAYTTTFSANYPQCGDTIEEVVKDMQLLAQLTTRIRLYGADCNQAELVFEAIKRTKVNLHVFVGIYIDGNETTYTRQRDTTFSVLDQYGVDNVLGITVGNEYILQQFTNSPANAPTAEQLLITKMADVRDVLSTKSYSKTLPVGTADAGSQVTPELSEAADYIMANTHAFFSGVGIEGAADWTAQFLVNDEPRYATQAGKTLYSAEVGWPSDALPGGSLTLNGSAASLTNLQTFLDTFVCAANDNITAGNPFGSGYFYFELFDAEWKRMFLGAEPFWGLFDSDRNLKDITIPSCTVQGEAPVNGNTGPSGIGNGNGNGNGNGGSGNNNSGTGALAISSAGLASFGIITASLALISLSALF